MALGSQADRSLPPVRGALRFAYWCAVVVYAWVALAPVFGKRAEGVSLWDSYVNFGLIGRGLAAACVYFLLRKDSRARWPAVLVACWFTLGWIGAVIASLSSGRVPIVIAVLFGGGIVFFFAVQASCVTQLHKRGVLR
jgi:hypothetical protein